MRRDVRWIALHFAVGVALLYMAGGCVTKGSAFRNATGVCRHNAVYCALTYWDMTGCPTRIAVGLHASGQSHAQAQAFVGGKWVCLQRWDNDVIQGRNELTKADRYFTVREFIMQMQIRHAMQLQPKE